MRNFVALQILKDGVAFFVIVYSILLSLFIKSFLFLFLFFLALYAVSSSLLFSLLSLLLHSLACLPTTQQVILKVSLEKHTTSLLLLDNVQPISINESPIRLLTTPQVNSSYVCTCILPIDVGRSQLNGGSWSAWHVHSHNNT